MSTMGRYCKAYPLSKLRTFAGWREKLENLRQDSDNDSSAEQLRTQLLDTDFLFLQENLTVTDGIFVDENIIFDNVTPEWKLFCEQFLDFKIPPLSDDQSTVGSAKPEAALNQVS